MNDNIPLWLDYYTAAMSVFHADVDWEVKYDLCFKAYKEARYSGPRLDYADPDTTFEEDTRALMTAWQAEADRIKRDTHVV